MPTKCQDIILRRFHFREYSKYPSRYGRIKNERLPYISAVPPAHTTLRLNARNIQIKHIFHKDKLAKYVTTVRHTKGIFRIRQCPLILIICGYRKESCWIKYRLFGSSLSKWFQQTARSWSHIPRLGRLCHFITDLPLIYYKLITQQKHRIRSLQVLLILFIIVKNRIRKGGNVNNVKHSFTVNRIRCRLA